jgi:hypothetical protein
VVQSAEPGHRNHSVRLVHRSKSLAPCRGLLLQPKVGSVLVVVAQILSHQALEMPLVKNDDMIEQVSPAITDEAFCDTVLPRAAKATPLGFDSEALDSADDLGIEIGCAIEYEILLDRIVREGFTQLLYRPSACRMLGYVTVEDVPPVVGDHEEAIDHSKRQRRHCEEVHSGNRLSVVAQKGRPLLRRLRTPGRLPHPAQHRPLRDIETKQPQLTVDPRGSPSAVLGHHAEDQLAQSLLTHLLPPLFRCRESHAQYNLKPARCQRTTVSGCTRTNAVFQPGQSRLKKTQKSLSAGASRG